MSDREPSSARLIGSLSFAGLASGLILVGSYLFTLPLIQQNEADALQAAIFRVLPGTATIEPMGVKEGKLFPEKHPKGDVVYLGRNKEGKALGFGVPAVGPGFADDIVLIYGFDHHSHNIVGMEVLTSRETPGLGDKINLDKAFLANFKKLLVDPKITPVKRGEKNKANEVDCITGATISSKAVVSVLNNSMNHWKKILISGVPETEGSLHAGSTSTDGSEGGSDE